MYASLRYISSHHPFGIIDSQPDLNPYSRDNQNAAAEGDGPTLPGQELNPQHSASANPIPGYSPDTHEEFESNLRELARDLVTKEQQIEYLVSVLPGIGLTEEEQEQRVRDLDDRLREVELAKVEALKERDRMLRRVECAIVRCRRAG